MQSPLVDGDDVGAQLPIGEFFYRQEGRCLPCSSLGAGSDIFSGLYDRVWTGNAHSPRTANSS